MMKNWRKVIVLAVVLAVFIAAFIFLNNINNIKDPNDPNDPADTGTEEKLLDIDRQEIKSITLKHGHEEFIFIKEEIEVESEVTDDEGQTKTVTEKKEIWTNPDIELDEAKINNIALSAELSTITRVIDEAPEDLSIYGLDRPIVVTLLMKDGTKHSIEVGGQTPTQDNYYVRRGGDKTVYTISKYRGDMLSYSKFDIMKKSLYEKDEVAVEDITALTFTRNGEKIFDSVFDVATSEWKITWPLNAKADMMEFPKFLQWLSGVTVSEFIEENASDLGQYGLEEPSYVFDFVLDGKQYGIRLGSKTDTHYYAKMNDNPMVFTVSSSNLNFVDLSLVDLIERFIYIPNIADVEKLVIEMDGRVDTLLIYANNEDKSKEEFFINGRKMETDNEVSLFRGYYQGAIGLMADRLDFEAKPEGQAEIRLTYTMKEAKPDKIVVVELIPTNDGYGYYLVKNNEYSGFVMGKRQLDKDHGIRFLYEKLVNGLTESASE
ncbi:MAG: DUF4340 domain-containing protein [Clostridiaceae bacterium]|nr:DUF4340 domain-containing protein [Clostridiaceae bacterium]